MDKRVPFFFSAFCSMMVGSTVLHTTAGVMLAGVGASAAERVQAVFTAANASGFSAPEIAPLGEIKAIKTGYTPAPQASANAGEDKIIVGIADAISARGENAQLDRIFLSRLNIPTQTGNGPVSIKRLRLTGDLDGSHPWTRTAILVVTDRRYVIFNMEIGETFNGVSTDETGTPIAAWRYRPDEGALSPKIAGMRLKVDREAWGKELLGTAVASTGA